MIDLSAWPALILSAGLEFGQLRTPEACQDISRGLSER